MKKIAFLSLPVFFIFMTLTGCIEDPKAKILDKASHDKDFVTSITWKDTTKNLGNIDAGQKLEVVYTFTNTGKKPLVIKDVRASCGCTVPERPQEPIMPGKGGFIKAIFNSEGRMGLNHKTITVQANTTPSETHQLEFTVNVKNTNQPA